jgi:hypothetical protein
MGHRSAEAYGATPVVLDFDFDIEGIGIRHR